MIQRATKLVALFTVLFLILLFSSPMAPINAKAATPSGTISLDAKGAILIDQQTGKVLYEKSQDGKLYPASTTKVLTALLALEMGNLDDVVTIGKEVNTVPWDSSKAYVKEGEQISLRELLMGLMLPSGNDAAAAVGVYVGRKASGDMALDATIALEKFIGLMNERAAKAGATNSNFVNPHGYHDKNHYTTAHDLALITKEAMKIDFFREIVSTFKYNTSGTPVYKDGQLVESIDHSWKNSNDLINESSKYYYEFATGVKTGYTSQSEFCIVSSATKGGMNLIAVVLGSTSQGRWTDPKKLLEYGFENYGYYKGAEKDEAIHTFMVDNSSSDSSNSLIAVTEEDYAATFNKDEVPRIEKKIVWDENIISPLQGEENSIKILSSIETGAVIGKEIFALDGSVIKEINLKAMEGVKKQGIIAAAAGAVEMENILWFLAGTVCGAMSIIILLIRAAKRRRRYRSYGYRGFSR